ncbi:MAG: hypothetical protein HQL48_02150 [Gammaproteobacteria bacterium]|nr:hypothetical protein [Gammaproteobacteria bacterium]
MASGIVLAKVEGTRNASQIMALGGKTFTVGHVKTAGAGLSNMVTLTPAGGGAPIAVKLGGARQVADLGAMVGKSVTIGKTPMMAAGGGKWLVLAPAGAAGASGQAAAASSATVLQLEGARQGMEAATLTGKTFTVAHPMVMGETAGGKWLFLQPQNGGDMVALKMANTAQATGMIGKTVTVGAPPMVAGNTGHFIALKPVAASAAAKGGTAGLAAKSMAAKGAAAKGGAAMAAPKCAAAAKTVAVAAPKCAMAGAGGASMQTVAMTNVVAPAGAATTAAAAAPAAAGTAAQTGTAAAKAGTAMAATTKATTAGAAVKGGTIWKGTGMSLGLGLGLGVWGPIILAGVGATAAYGYFRGRKAETE